MIKVFVGKKAKGEELRWESLSAEELASICSTPALFGGDKTYVLVGALAELADLLETFADSPHTFIFEEEKVLKQERTKVEKAGAKVEEEKVVKVEYRFDHYGVAAALGARDRKKLWLGITAALGAGEKPEMLAGLLCWKARSMRDVALSRTLVCLYHDSHRGVGDLGLLLERFALTL